jgi:deazaflavin-dependent oxidoreductase (nitroreductase family)|tara:strand:+ start:256 stop:690 length:435 start_codon:yes stop_codon:yes gene_type:complete
MAEYIPPALDWVREQVELYEGSGGTEGTTLRDTGLPCIIVTHMGNKTGGVRKIPLMRVKVDNSYVLVGSYGGRPKDPVWVYNLRAKSDVEIRDKAQLFKMRVREVTDNPERQRLWDAAAKAFSSYNDYQAKAARRIPVFIAEPV